MENSADVCYGKIPYEREREKRGNIFRYLWTGGGQYDSRPINRPLKEDRNFFLPPAAYLA
jgi:hypothetical protein